MWYKGRVFVRRLLVASCAFLVLVVATVLGSVRAYRVFTREELIAEVRCELAPAGAPYNFAVQITPVENGRPGRSEKFPMMGDQWAVGGDFLKWCNGLNLVGLRNRHKLTRLSSRYWTASDELTKPRTVYDLNGGSSRPWRWLYRYGVQLPFVDAVYGTTAYVPARPGERWGVYVGQAGYLIRPLEGKS